MQSQTQWTVEDWLANRCAKNEIGRAKPDMAAVQAGLEEFSSTVEAITPPSLKQDILEAYRQLGGTKYLMQNPALLNKLLIKLASDSPPSPTVQVHVHAPWMTSERLSYRRDPGVVDIAPALAGNAMLERLDASPEK